jgi:hypothetical protein
MHSKQENKGWHNPIFDAAVRLQVESLLRQLPYDVLFRKFGEELEITQHPEITRYLEKRLRSGETRWDLIAGVLNQLDAPFGYGYIALQPTYPKLEDGSPDLSWYCQGQIKEAIARSHEAPLTSVRSFLLINIPALRQIIENEPPTDHTEYSPKLTTALLSIARSLCRFCQDLDRYDDQHPGQLLRVRDFEAAETPAPLRARAERRMNKMTPWLPNLQPKEQVVTLNGFTSLWHLMHVARDQNVQIPELVAFLNDPAGEPLTHLTNRMIIEEMIGIFQDKNHPIGLMFNLQLTPEDPFIHTETKFLDGKFLVLLVVNEKARQAQAYTEWPPKKILIDDLLDAIRAVCNARLDLETYQMIYGKENMLTFAEYMAKTFPD